MVPVPGQVIFRHSLVPSTELTLVLYLLAAARCLLSSTVAHGGTRVPGPEKKREPGFNNSLKPLLFPWVSLTGRDVYLIWEIHSLDHVNLHLIDARFRFKEAMMLHFVLN
jgi:hypothetical protein